MHYVDFYKEYQYYLSLLYKLVPKEEINTVINELKIDQNIPNDFIHASSAYDTAKHIREYLKYNKYICY